MADMDVVGLKAMTDELGPVSAAFHIGTAELRIRQAREELDMAVRALKNEEALRAEVLAGRQFRRQVREWFMQMAAAEREQEDEDAALWLEEEARALGLDIEEQADD